MTEVLNLFDEAPEPYGPQRRSRAGEVGVTSKGVGHGSTRDQRAGERYIKAMAVKTEHPLGAPPLDWWVIDG